MCGVPPESARWLEPGASVKWKMSADAARESEESWGRERTGERRPRDAAPDPSGQAQGCISTGRDEELPNTDARATRIGAGPDLSFGTAMGTEIIEGDNLQVMVSLRSQYQGAVDVAYLDPPYNTGKQDFPYSDRRFHDPNADADDMVYVNNEDGGRHTKWLNFMGPRLWLTWQLLADHGICFVSINDVELFRLGMLMDEIFGEQNRIGIIVWKSRRTTTPAHRHRPRVRPLLCEAHRAGADALGR